jgi:hypothetical protein
MKMRHNTLSKLFRTSRPIIGAIHLPPLLGYPEFPGFDVAIQNALHDLRTLERGGVNGVIFENNYDIPHTVSVSPAVVSAMTRIGNALRSATKLPMGVSVLWNDFQAALSIAKTLDFQFVRVPVFVDTVKTDYGVIKGDAKAVRVFRKSLDAENIALFTDIQVKHAELLSKRSLAASARLAVRNGADALIVTGKWTGNAPHIDDLEDVRTAVHDFPILIGSGLGLDNATSLLRVADGAIVSTALKKETPGRHARNIKPYEARIDGRKVRALMRSVQ